MDQSFESVEQGNFIKESRPPRIQNLCRWWEIGINVDGVYTDIDENGDNLTAQNDHEADGTPDDVYIIDCDDAATNLQADGKC